MTTLSQTMHVSSGETGLPWWAILLIIIGCVLIAVSGVVGYNFYSRRKLKKFAEDNVKQNGMDQLEYEMERAKNQYVEVGDV